MAWTAASSKSAMHAKLEAGAVYLALIPLTPLVDGPAMGLLACRAADTAFLVLTAGAPPAALPAATAWPLVVSYFTGPYWAGP